MICVHRLRDVDVPCSLCLRPRVRRIEHVYVPPPMEPELAAVVELDLAADVAEPARKLAPTIKRVRRPRDPALDARLRALHRAGKSCREIGMALGRHPESIRGALVARGLKPHAARSMKVMP